MKMRPGTLVKFINRNDECMLLVVLETEGDWTHCSYQDPKQSGGLNEQVKKFILWPTTKTGWFRTELLTEVEK